MKVFISVATLLAVASAQHDAFVFDSFGAIPPTGYIAPTPIKTQYHTQDALGQYSYGYSDGLSAKEEVKTLDGSTRGSYSYIDANGELQSVDYTADALNGFRVAGTNLPKALPVLEPTIPKSVEDTREVAEAKAAHNAAHIEAKRRSGELYPADRIDLPNPVEDTPEVAEAKIAHFAAKKDAELRNRAIETIRSESATRSEIPQYQYITALRSGEVIPALSTLPALRTAASIPASYIYNYNPFAFNGRLLHPSIRY